MNRLILILLVVGSFVIGLTIDIIIQSLFPFLELGIKWGIGRTSTTRIIATTNVDDADIREDIRGRVWEVEVPPLYKRRLDIPRLIEHFLQGVRPMPTAKFLMGLT